MQNNKTIMITSDFEILKYSKTFFSTLCTKIQTNTQIQKNLLKPIKPKINIDGNKK